MNQSLRDGVGDAKNAGKLKQEEVVKGWEFSFLFRLTFTEM